MGEEESGTVPADDVKSVMEAHVDELMALPGVVGVAVGATVKGRPCIRVLVVEDTPEIRRRIPRELEGYPVEIDETGRIRALPDDEG